MFTLNYSYFIDKFRYLSPGWSSYNVLDQNLNHKHTVHMYILVYTLMHVHMYTDMYIKPLVV